jgi:hypothetical protein
VPECLCERFIGIGRSVMRDVGAETTCHQCHSRVATRRPSVLVPARGLVSRLSRGHGGRVPGCDHRGGESCYLDRSHARVGRVSPSCFRTNVPHSGGELTLAQARSSRLADSEGIGLCALSLRENRPRRPLEPQNGRRIERLLRCLFSPLRNTSMSPERPLLLSPDL